MTDMNIAFFKNHLPHIEMVSFADGVHDLVLQKPQETAALILDFTGSSDSGPLVTASEPEP
jgi:hypothetical protein